LAEWSKFGRHAPSPIGSAFRVPPNLRREALRSHAQGFPISRKDAERNRQGREAARSFEGDGWVSAPLSNPPFSGQRG
jgi:hypothetical protein